MMAEGKITHVHLPRSGGKAFECADPLVRTKRVGIWLVTSPNYSGGRVHLFQYAWVMADAGAEVFLVTNMHPRWAADYPPQKNIHVVNVDRSDPPDDLDLIVTDSKGGMGQKALEYQSTHPHIPLAVMNFEDPQWIETYVPEKKGKYQTDKSVFKKANLLIANSAESRKWLLKWLGTDQRCEVLPPCVNTFAVHDARPPSGVRIERPFAVWSARNDSYKGVEAATEAIWTLDIPFDLALFGAESQRMPKPTSKHKALMLQGRPDCEKFWAMAHAHMVLAPSRFEGAGMVPMEALASGTPCVAYDLEVLHELYADSLIYVERGNKKAFCKKVSELAHKQKLRVNPKPAREEYGMMAMRRKVEKMPYHLVKERKSISAQLICYWGFLDSSIASVYDLVDEIIVAFGPCPQAQRFDDGSLERIQSFPDPGGKIRVEVREQWKDKKEMRQWCSHQAHGNYQLVLDGDEVWVGLDRWIGADIAFGCPRWVNLWHGGKHWIYDKENVKGTAPVGRRWGHRLNPFGSTCPHYRWSWWRPSFYWRTHPIPANRDGHFIHNRDNTFAERCPEAVIYHLGHALPEAIMRAKHEFYLKRDGDDKGRRQRMAAWHNWSGEAGDCGDGMVSEVDWKLPSIVKKALASARKLGDGHGE